MTGMDEIKSYSREPGLQELHNAELKIIRLLAEICEKEKLTYYLLFGTMLGAVRHKGFIPWDEDADFGMPRPDYEKLLKVIDQYIPDDIVFLVQGRPKWDTIDNKRYFARIENLQMQVKCTGFQKDFIRNAWIEIFPLDGLPNNPFYRWIHRMRLNVLKKLYTVARFDMAVPLKKAGRSWFNQIGVFLCSHLPVQSMFCLTKRWMAYDRALRKYSYEECDYFTDAVCTYGAKGVFKKTVLGEGAFYEFEGLKLRGPEDYDAYLSQLYGDYMTPPPPQNRVRHSIEFMEGRHE